MGCVKSKVDVEPPKADLSAPPAPPPTDSRLPLNAREVFKLKKSWKGIKRNMEDTGVELFVGLFKNNIRLKDFFKNFRGLSTEEEMRMNETLSMHGVMVLSSIDDMIMVIDEVDNVINQCAQLKEAHGTFPGFDHSFFWYIEQALLAAVKLTLADACTEQMAEIYRKAFHFILSNLSGHSSKDQALNKVTPFSQRLENG